MHSGEGLCINKTQLCASMQAYKCTKHINVHIHAISHTYAYKNMKSHSTFYLQQHCPHPLKPHTPNLYEQDPRYNEDGFFLTFPFGVKQLSSFMLCPGASAFPCTIIYRRTTKTCSHPWDLQRHPWQHREFHFSQVALATHLSAT